MRPLWASVVTDHRRTPPPLPNPAAVLCMLPRMCGYWDSVLLAAVGLLVRNSSSSVWLCRTCWKVLDEQACPLDPKPVGRRRATHPAETAWPPRLWVSADPPVLPFPLFPARPGSQSAVAHRLPCLGREYSPPGDFSGGHPRGAPNSPRWELKAPLLTAKIFSTSHQKAAALGCRAVKTV